ncbi:chitobiosyldiphosphodolichol [Trichuris trichiura]|uniref:Chitobiosyldiphosphodolichol n=1 Tax=Trichuris trichiura TaxID=36087 RepID=A0A077Z1Z2_TRITR|nr:chitobiosyldiphosphodolichol [Trichuris trichiura]
MPPNSQSRNARVCVVVLGDIGRSPRMEYHSLSLADKGVNVELIGYSGSNPIGRLAQHELVTFHYLPEPPLVKPRLLHLAVKLFWQLLSLLFCLVWRVPRSDVILLQNPPALPALLVCVAVAALKGSRLIIDWHNYTSSMLAQKWSTSNTINHMANLYEFGMGRCADANLCVTDAMRSDLIRRGIGRVTTFHDRPFDAFAPLSINGQHDFLTLMAKRYAEFRIDEHESRFTFEQQDGTCVKRTDRPCILLTSTSWTPDEDFGLLLEALTIYSQYPMEDDQTSLPALLVVITGKGSLREEYLRHIQEVDFSGRVSIVTMWLQAEEYPLLLACADVGLSLHSSTSGLDLPMKVVDMFGCGLPVLALNFQALPELVHDSIDGMIFENAEQLADHLRNVLKGFPKSHSVLDDMRRRLMESPLETWNKAWEKIVWPVFTTTLNGGNVAQA